MFKGDQDPFGYPLSTYLWVLGLALFGGAVKYINRTDKFKPLILLRDLVTAGFAGLLTFWVCQWQDIGGPVSAILIATSGLMGTKALSVFEKAYEGYADHLGGRGETQHEKVEIEIRTEVKKGD